MMLTQAGIDRLERVYRANQETHGDFGMLLEQAEQQAAEIVRLQALVSKLRLGPSQRVAQAEETATRARVVDWLHRGPAAQCTICRRKTWDLSSSFDNTCGMTQPDGSSCPGSLVAL
jgi:hypothetical protein